METKNKIASLIIAAFFTVTGFTQTTASERICTQEEAIAAESLVATSRSWKELHQQFGRYSHCDDGAIGEGFSESVTLLLSERWQDIRQLERIVKTDPAFRNFIIRHIDETVPAERLNRIAQNANKRCPRHMKELCRDIKAATKK